MIGWDRKLKKGADMNHESQKPGLGEKVLLTRGQISSLITASREQGFLLALLFLKARRS